MKKLILVLTILFSVSLIAQTKEADKSFINKNYHALLLIQKQIVAQQLTSSQDVFINLAALQAEVVYLYSKKPQDAIKLAYLVRQESLKFMDQYSPNSSEYFRQDFEKGLVTIENYSNVKFSLPDDKLKNIKSLNVNDLNCTKNLLLSL